MADAALVGVVTVTHNSGTVIRDFMESLLNQSYRKFRLYVVDNASCDETLTLLAQYSDPRLIIIRNATNVGVAEGNNIGIRTALSDGCNSVLLLNNDTTFGADVFSKLNDGLGKYQCDMIVPKILYFDAADKIWSAGGAFSPMRGRCRHLGLGEKDDGRFDQPRKVEYSPTCCMLIARQVFERIGIMDPNYFVYFDDTDFCLRARRAGIRLVYSPDTTVFHKVSSIIGHYSDIFIRYVTRNHVYYVLKNFGFLQRLYYLPVCQAHIFVTCWPAKNVAKAFWIAQQAFWEGIEVYRATQRSAVKPPVPPSQREAAPQSVLSSTGDVVKEGTSV